MSNLKKTIINNVWSKAKRLNPENDDFRLDICGAIIRKDMYGRSDSIYGWTVDHVFPTCKMSSTEHKDELVNLQAINCLNNIAKGKNFPNFECVVTSIGNQNIRTKISQRICEETLVKLCEYFPDIKDYLDENKEIK